MIIITKKCYHDDKLNQMAKKLSVYDRVKLKLTFLRKVF